MVAFSKPLPDQSWLKYIWAYAFHGKKKALSFSILSIIIFFLIQNSRNRKRGDGESGRKTTAAAGDKNKKPGSGRGKGNVDSVFLNRIVKLLKIVIPSWKSKEILDIVLLTLFLLFRTYLSIYLATVKGRIVKGIIQRDFSFFVKGLLNLALCAIPGSFINSALTFFNRRLAINFRKRLTDYFLDKYLNNLIYYQITNLDQRIATPDQRLTTDIEKWASSLSTLYSNISKPILDIILFSRKLSSLVGWQGPMYVILWYFFTGVVIRVISPPFGRMIAIEQKLEGEYRACHSGLVNHSEEIAFFRGNAWEKRRVNETFERLIAQTYNIMSKRLFMGCFDSILVRYGATLVGYAVIGMPVFGKNREEYIKKVGSDASKITRDYVRNSSLLIDLAGAIGRLIVSYKNIQLLAGYTSLIYEMKTVLEDMEQGKFERTMIDKNKEQIHEMKNLSSVSKGEIVESDMIKFEKVPIVSPSGDILVEELNFEIRPGMNCIISGPNGCGKSSLFRILGQLWPIYGGRVHRPKLDKMFYIPQRPYLPAGNLRDQIIYPHRKLEMLRKRFTDEHLRNILKDVQCEYLMEREGGLDAVLDWNDVLSGGEKQRLAMARLFYHKPAFAILDECTSSTSLDVEQICYNKCKELEITLFTVSHRTSLFKFHEYILKFDGEGGWDFSKIKVEGAH